MALRRFTRSAAQVAALPLLLLLGFTVVSAQQGAKDGQWLAYGGDKGQTHYSPLTQINKDNFSKLEVAWRFKPTNLGDRPDFNMQATPLMVNGTLYLTAGSSRNAVALDAKTGEMIGCTGSTKASAPRPRCASSRRAASATGPMAKAMSASTSSPSAISWCASMPRPVCPVPGFGKNGIIDLKTGGDQILDPITSEIGWNGSPVIGKDVVIVGASHRGGSTPRTKENAKGYVRGVRHAGPASSLWIFHTIPQSGRVRQRHLVERLVVLHRPHRCVGAVHRR